MRSKGSAAQLEARRWLAVQRVKDIPFETLAKFFRVWGAELRDRESDLGPYAVRVWR